MFITLTRPDREAPLLQQAIDNTDGKLYVALREIHYEVNFNNVGGDKLRPPTMEWYDHRSGLPQFSIVVPPRFFTAEELLQFLIEKLPGLTMEINTRGYITIDTTATRGMVRFNFILRRVLGIDEAGIINGIYEGDRPVELLVHKWLYIYLDQLSTISNLVDGAPSALFAIVPVATSGVVDITPHNPMYKKLEAGHIHQTCAC